MKCPFCLEESYFLYRIKRFKNPISIYQCPKCKLQMQSVFKNIEYYTKGYYEGTSDYSYFDERKYYQYCEYVWKARLKTIKKYKPPPARLLDIGCSFGGFIKTALQMGYDAEGVDISQYVIKENQKDPILRNRVYQSDLLSFSSKKKYDIITLIEVLEHLPEPDKIFQKLSELLTENGLLIIQTANFDGLQAKLQKQKYHYYLPGHIFYYSKSNLIPILKKYDFKTFISFHGVDFGLLPKLKKMRGFIQDPLEYYKFMKAILYHLLSKIYFKNFSLTSSFVLYAFKSLKN